MYATPDARAHVDIVVITLHPAAAMPHLARPFGVARLENGKLTPVDHSIPLPIDVWRPALHAAQALRDREALRFLVEIAHHGPELRSAVVARVERRADPMRRVTFAEIDAYTYRDGKVTPYRQVTTVEVSANDVWRSAVKAAGLWLGVLLPRQLPELLHGRNLDPPKTPMRLPMAVQLDAVIPEPEALVATMPGPPTLSASTAMPNPVGACARIAVSSTPWFVTASAASLGAETELSHGTGRPQSAMTTLLF
jgi:hypothetical protein